MNRRQSVITRFFCVSALVFLLVGQTVRADGPKKILILPFAVNAQEDLTFLQKGVEDMLSSRLVQEGKVAVISRAEAGRLLPASAGPLTADQVFALAGRVGADYAVFGSLTVFGDSISTDARCLDVADRSTPVTFSQAGKTQGDVIGHINRFAGQINAQVFGRQTVSAQPATAAAPVPDSRKHPDKIWQESATGAYMYGTQAEGGQASFAVWKSRKFKGDITGTAVADVDGDGANEVVFLNDSTVRVYRYAAGRFVKVVDIAEKPYNRLLSIDAADINGNGTAEIYVTCLPANSYTLSSFVLEWNGRGFEKIGDRANWYYRVVEIPNRGRVLYGQERGTVNDTFGENALFTGMVTELRWKNRRLEPAERILLPRHVTIYGFAIGDVMNDGTEAVAAFSPRDYVRITDREGNLEWSSDERYGGSATYLELRGVKQEGDHPEDLQMERHFLRQRIHIADLDGDDKNELIVVKNHDATGQFLDQTRYYKSGHIECLAWDVIGMRLKWRTHKTGYISDYVIGDLNNDGTDEVVFSVVLKSGPILGKSRSYIASLTLQPEKP